MIGTTKRKIIVVPWRVNSSLKCSGVRKLLFGTASCTRISSASMPPIKKKANDETMYMIPIFL